MRKYLSILICTIVSFFMIGCASVQVQDEAAEKYTKEYNAPPSGWSGLYIYRKCFQGGYALKKSLYVDGEYIGETADCTYFYRLVTPGEHTLQTESEFSENHINVDFIEGQNHFVKQRIKFGIFVGGARLDVTDFDEAELSMRDASLAENQDNDKLNLRSFKDEEGKGSIPGPKNQNEADAVAK
jgi:hypothetical protein